MIRAVSLGAVIIIVPLLVLWRRYSGTMPELMWSEFKWALWGGPTKMYPALLALNCMGAFLAGALLGKKVGYNK